ncbi:extracellular solute-binding protein [Ferrimonas balearica]|nr:extracellular solute-binding protein [Ferrimonas balearica]
MLRKLLVAATAIGLASGAQAQDQTDLLSKSWDDIVAQAKDEGSVNWFVWYFQPRYRELAEAFTAEYGIEVMIPEGTHEGNIDKVLAETGRESGDVDLLAMGADRIELFKQENLVGPLNDVLPNAGTMTTEVGGFDGQGYGWAYWGNQTGIAYDPEAIDEADLPQSVEDFAAYWDANPGRFGFNYENGGSGPSFFTHVARNVTDADFTSGEVTEEKMDALQPAWDFFLDHTDGYIITASNTDSLIRLSNREFALVPAWEDHLFKLQGEKEVSDRIKFYIPEFGMTGGGNINVIPANAPHPAAALVFLNWVSSPETQTRFNEVFGAAPMNSAADDSHALIPNDMRARAVSSPANPFNTELRQAFIEHVALER